ncbi:DEAD/DEAH box helicase [Bacillus sp. NTK071]|uniref:DEAD/DEAH box helicase n=1 Tax=Bacillus sp. NTK071 TaxID=2802175 RepID=UPI001A8FC54D|nr:DEAD/DEAH box helicase [Bacillus sp. NTK071]MBN8208928.1 DEAD/DEAH box helicase [Bacillus sp. NTK071]
MGSFNLLSKTIQKKIWRMKWESFTHVQDKAIPAVIETDHDIILSSGTASGKTEAAFLPIISMIEKEAEETLKVMYISPLKALINNQFERIESLCDETNIPIHRWHGDISQSKKKKFVQKPAGILQITPESIESLFLNRTEQLRNIFKGCDFIVIDEIHSFLDDERGVHLRSLLSRLERYMNKRPRIIGLSATIDNFSLVKDWVNFQYPEKVTVIESIGSDKNLLYSLMHFDGEESHKTPLNLFEDIRDLTRNQKALIFCNSRGLVEEATVLLNRLATREGMGETYFPHHSSIDKKEREHVEKTMSESTLPKSVVATSSLELGIDIGSIDIVIQIDSTFTVSALKQRLGRSGRKKDSNQMLQLYSTKSDSLIQSVAVMELVRDKWVEPAIGYPIPYDILFHQIISICKETNGIQLRELINMVKSNAMFESLLEENVRLLVEFMLQNEHLEKIKGSNELIVGIEGERLLRGKEFYSVFMTNEQYEVIENVKRIGTIDKLMFLNESDNIILAGKLWKIKTVDSERNKIYVNKAFDGKPPKYLSGGVKIHKKIAAKIMELLCSTKDLHYLDEEGNATLQDMRRSYRYNKLSSGDRVIWRDKDTQLFETFTGTTITNTLVWMLRSKGIYVLSRDGLGRIELPIDCQILTILNEISEEDWSVADLLTNVRESEFFMSKYKPFLPKSLQDEMHVAHEMDVEGVKAYLDEFDFKVISVHS